MTNTRVEHLPETEKKKHKSINPLQDFLGAAHDHAQSNNLAAIEAPPTSSQSGGDSASDSGADKGGASNEPHLSLEEYFTEPKDKSEYDGKCGIFATFLVLALLNCAVNFFSSFFCSPW